MNGDDIAFVALIIVGIMLILLLVVALPVVLVDGIYYNPMRADDAQEQCLIKGFDNYESFRGYPLSKKAIAVRCKYAHEIRFEGEAVPTKEVS